MKLQYSLSALIFCTFLAAMAMRGGQWGYENVWVPSQPIAWAPYSPEALEKALASGRPVLLHFGSRQGEAVMAVPMNAVFDTPDVRQAVY
ncbi:MAG: DUF255 domain-containing protein, partial [Planctomycetales bacterium]|nr:DUF255 domain-containing protein [Planctomycetales bacterium]